VKLLVILQMFSMKFKLCPLMLQSYGKISQFHIDIISIFKISNIYQNIDLAIQNPLCTSFELN